MMRPAAGREYMAGNTITLLRVVTTHRQPFGVELHKGYKLRDHRDEQGTKA